MTDEVSEARRSRETEGHAAPNRVIRARCLLRTADAFSAGGMRGAPARGAMSESSRRSGNGTPRASRDVRLRSIVAVCSVLALAGCSGSDIGSIPKRTVPPPADKPQEDVPAQRREQPPPNDQLVVATTLGPIHGKLDGNARAFLGVPFAAPPVGERRFRAPAPAEPWREPRETTAYGNMCVQFWATGQLDGNEDCLYLNVWAPKADAPSSGPRPVLFFIHGGALVVGSAHQAEYQGQKGNLYDGRAFAEKLGAIVVSTNYRLGQLGFLAHPALAAEDEHHSSGNYGMLDQIAALRWAHDNVAAFGGDPSRVMIFGESAGGLSTCLLVSSPLAKGLFSRALIESGGCIAATRESREGQGATLVEKAQCSAAPDVPACLRSKPANLFEVPPIRDLLGFANALDYKRGWEMPYGPNVDGWVFPEAPITAIKNGRHSKVPLTVGTNANEMELLLPPVVNTCLEYEAVTNAFRPFTEPIRQLYPCRSYALPRQAAVAFMTDWLFTCPARRILRAAAQGGSPALFRYFFPHTYTRSPKAVMRSFHTAELPFVFDTFPVFDYTPTEPDKALSAAMMGYWTSFASTGDPNHGGAPLWPRYEVARDDAIVLTEPIAQTSGIATERCDLWDRAAVDE
jgi:para-nitrobenzyl esterase